MLALAFSLGMSAQGKAQGARESKRRPDQPLEIVGSSLPLRSSRDSKVVTALEPEGIPRTDGDEYSSLDRSSREDSTANGHTEQQHRGRSREVKASCELAPELEAKLQQSIWRAPGQCLNALTLQRRQVYLAGFERSSKILDKVPKEEQRALDVRAAPGVTDTAKRHAVITMVFVEKAFPRQFSVPTVYLHQSIEAMQRFACVAASAVSYYDGSIHAVAFDDHTELRKSLRHEFAHHIVTELGVTGPLWFHEGFAQLFAEEYPNIQDKGELPLNLATMSGPLRTTSTQEEVSRFYYQSAVMMQFLNQLHLRHERDDASLLVQALAKAMSESRTTPDELFLWATRERAAEIFDGGPEKLWLKYYAEGDLPTEVSERLRLKTSH